MFSASKNVLALCKNVLLAPILGEFDLKSSIFIQFLPFCDKYNKNQESQIFFSNVLKNYVY